MMSGHGANPIFFNKKNKDWTSRTLANPPPYVREHLIFTLAPQSPLFQSGHHMSITPYLGIFSHIRAHSADSGIFRILALPVQIM